MKPLVIYYSRTGNTVKVAESIAQALDADLLTSDSVADSDLVGRPLVALGSGVYYLRHDESIDGLIERLPPESRVIFFTTCGIKFFPFVNFYKARIARKLSRKGLALLGHWYCPGYDQQPALKPLGLNRDRPNDQDLEAAAEFAAAFRPGST